MYTQQLKNERQILCKLHQNHEMLLLLSDFPTYCCHLLNHLCKLNFLSHLIFYRSLLILAKSIIFFFLISLIIPPSHAQIHVFAIECGLTVIIIFEILTRMISNKRVIKMNRWTQKLNFSSGILWKSMEYCWSYWHNNYNNSILRLSVLWIEKRVYHWFFILEKLINPSERAKHSEESDLIPAALLGARYFAQIFRIMLTLKQYFIFSSRNFYNYAKESWCPKCCWSYCLW